MPERPDLRQIAGNIREALADYDRDALAEILAYVFKEYVVQTPPPLLLNQTERIEDLEGLSFAELITTLQTRLDLPQVSPDTDFLTNVIIDCTAHILAALEPKPMKCPECDGSGCMVCRAGIQ